MEIEIAGEGAVGVGVSCEPRLVVGVQPGCDVDLRAHECTRDRVDLLHEDADVDAVVRRDRGVEERAQIGPEEPALLVEGNDIVTRVAPGLIGSRRRGRGRHRHCRRERAPEIR